MRRGGAIYVDYWPTMRRGGAYCIMNIGSNSQGWCLLYIEFCLIFGYTAAIMACY